MKTLAPKVMPVAGVTVYEAEQALGLAQNLGYRHIQRGKLRAFTNGQGLLRITEAEIYRYLREEK